ncbi:MAG: polyprenyl synthetase family protein [bacterium]
MTNKVDRLGDTVIDFEAVLKSMRSAVWNKVKEYLPTGLPKDFHELLWEYPTRQGKYFRPGLMILATEMFGGKRSDALLVAAALQVCQDWILIHDDFEDDAEERRSTPNEHRMALHRLHGSEIAVNAGDALHVIMWRMVGDCVRQFGDQRGWMIYDKFVDILMTTARGQHIELKWQRDRWLDMREDDFFSLVDIKAGYYTTAGPVQIGGFIAGVSDRLLDGALSWCIPFGRAFQVWDDVMNLTVDTVIQGKEKAGDITEGKRTLILIHLLDHCSVSDAQEVRSFYVRDRGSRTHEERERILAMMKRCGSIEYAATCARELGRIAKERFDVYGEGLPDSFAKRAIRTGIDYATSRRR